MSEQRRRRPGPVVIDRELIYSGAFLGLTGTAHVVLMNFMGKRQMAKVSHPKRKDVWEITNNLEITYTYKEAEKRGISRPSFQRAIDQLIERGFIDVAQSGAGVFKAATFYSISERWRKWGTDDFVRKARPRKARWNRNVGFQKGHPPYPQNDKS